MKIKTWHCVAGLFGCVAAAYFFSLSAGYNSVDDLKRISWMENTGSYDVVRLFFSGGGRYYYRPLGTLSFFLDRDLWGSIASFMHLENMLIHFCNALMVYFVTRRIAIAYSIPAKTPALVAGLLFAWHPLATEVVCWISGRYDLLACFFLLLTIWLLIVSLQRNQAWIATFGMISLLLACLSKEIAVFTLPGLLWLIFYFEGRAPFWETLRRRLVVLLCPVVAVSGYLLMRYFATARDIGVKTAIKGVASSEHYDLFDKVRIAFKVYGFYFKKFFIPWPLNFGIVNVSGYYVVSGVILFVILIWLLWRRDLPSSLALTSFLALSPALLVVFGHMAWTLIAERYLYSSIALGAPALVVWGTGAWLRGSGPVNKTILYIFAVILIVFYVSTTHRVWVWQDNERLFRDTVEKSPSFDPAKSELATALIRKGKKEEAEKILEGMQNKSHAESFVIDDMNLAAQLMGRGELDQARELLLPLLDKNKKSRARVLKQLIKLNYLRENKAAKEERADRAIIQRETIGLLQQQQDIKFSPHNLYQIAKLQMRLGEDAAAIASFDEVLKTVPADAFYRGAAETMRSRLSDKQKEEIR